MSLLTMGASIIGAIKGSKADKAKNKRAKEQFEMDKKLAQDQLDISKYIQEYAKQAGSLNGETTDIYGGRTYFDPVTKTYKTALGDTQKGIQDASDSEEAKRFSLDQQMRRQGLNDFETMRDRSAGESDAAFNDYQNLKRGIGTVDAGRVGSQIRADRVGAINAGYDDAERAAQTLQLRTGSSAVGDALSSLARDRTRAHASIGSPELEGIQLAEDINRNRTSDALGKYQLFGGEGRQFYDANYQPSIYNAEAMSRVGDLQKFDMGKLDLAMGGSGQAAQTIGQAGAGLRQGFLASEGSRIHAPGAKLWQGIGAAVGAEEEKIMGIFKKMGGG